MTLRTWFLHSSITRLGTASNWSPATQSAKRSVTLPLSLISSPGSQRRGEDNRTRPNSPSQRQIGSGGSCAQSEADHEEQGGDGKKRIDLPHAALSHSYGAVREDA